MSRQPAGIVDLSRRCENIERGIASIDAAILHFTNVAPELAAFVEGDLPGRVDAIEASIAALVQPADPTANLGYELPGLALATRPILATARSMGHARAAVTDALRALRSALHTYQGCAQLAVPSVDQELGALREHAVAARGHLAKAKADRQRVTRRIAEEMDAVQAEREALAEARRDSLKEAAE